MDIWNNKEGRFLYSWQIVVHVDRKIESLVMLYKIEANMVISFHIQISFFFVRPSRQEKQKKTNRATINYIFYTDQI